jgi:hypothetical protein
MPTLLETLAPKDEAKSPEANPYAAMAQANPYADPSMQAPTGHTAGQSLGLGVRNVMEGVGGLADFAATPIRGPINAAANLIVGHPVIPTLTEGAIDPAADKMGLATPITPGEKLAATIQKGALSMLAPFPGVAGPKTLLELAKLAAIGGGAAAGGEAAAEHAPEAIKPLVNLGAGLAAGLATHGAIEAPGAVARTVGRAVEPFAAGVSPKAAETAAARRLHAAASDPAAAAAALEHDGEILPGSQPTTFQQTGDLGLGGLERGVAARNPEAFAQRRGDQNAARVEALSGLQQGADPNDVAKALKAQFEDLSATHDATVDAATEAAAAKTAAMGAETVPEGVGATLRSALSDANDAAKAVEGRLWKAVDPEGDLTANVTETTQAAEKIAGDQPKTAKPLEGEAGAVFEAAAAMPPVSPLSDLIALRSRVSTAMREARKAGDDQAGRQLTQLRGAIESNLSNTIAQQVRADDLAVARGTLAEDEALGAKLKAQVGDWREQRAATGGGGGAGATGFAGERASAVPGGSGAAGEAERGLGDATGNQSLPAGPTADADAAARLAAASDATKQRKATFGADPVKGVLAEKGMKGDYRLPNGEVPRKFFRPGPGGYEAMQSLLKAAPEALTAMVDYAATSLRRAAADASGVIDGKKFETWAKAHKDALRALPPEARAKFQDAASAGQTVAEALANRTARLKTAQEGALGKVMNLTTAEDVTKTVGQVLNGRTAVADMKSLAKATSGNPVARAGLRQAVADFMTQKLVGNTEAGASGVKQIKADAYLTFIKEKRGALNLVFKPEEVRTMEAIGEDIARSKRSENAVRLPGGSNTAQDQIAARKGGLLDKGGRTILDAVAGVAGFHFGGPITGGAAIVGSHMLQSLRASGIERIDQLLTEAMLHPNVAKELLRKAPQKLNPNATKPLAAALRTAQRASFAAVQAPTQDKRQ